MCKDGALYVEGAEEIKPVLKELSQFAWENHITVVSTCDLHVETDEELSDTPDFINTFPNHCIKGTQGTSFIDETDPYTRAYSIVRYTRPMDKKDVDFESIVVPKNKFDVFEGNPNTDELVKLLNPETVVVYGVATNVCVNCAVLGLLKRGIKVIVVEDAIKELPNMDVANIYQNWILKGAHIRLFAEIKTMIKEDSNAKL